MTANTIGVAGLSLASVTANVQYAINTAATLGNANAVFAQIDATTSTLSVTLTDGTMNDNTATLTCSTTGISLGGATFSGGGASTDITASGVEDPNDAGSYELQLTSASGGYVRLVQTDGTPFTANATTNGGDPTAGTADAALALNTGSAAYVSDWPSADEDFEWFSSAASGASWDGANIQTQSGAQLALAQIDAAINTKDTARASLGALQNRLENTITNLQIQAENLQASESRISDVDVALEMTEFTRNNIMTQAAVSMLAQANSLPQLALQLLG